MKLPTCEEKKSCKRRQTTIKEWSVKSLRTAEWVERRRKKKKQRDHGERRHSWPYVCSYAVQLVASQLCWPPLHAPSPHHSPACLDAQQPPPMHLSPLLLLPKQPHYDCVSSDRPTTSYLSAGTGSFTSAGHRFNTGGLAGWWTGLACRLKLFCRLTGRRIDGAEVIAERPISVCDARKYPRTSEAILMSWLGALINAAFLKLEVRELGMTRVNRVPVQQVRKPKWIELLSADQLIIMHYTVFYTYKHSRDISTGKSWAELRV